MEEKNIDVNVDEVDDLVNRYKTHKKKRRKVALVIVAAFLLLVIVVSLIVFFVNKMSYRSTVDDFMDAYIAKDSSAILDMSSSYYSAKKQYNISIVETVNYYNKIVTNAHANFKANLNDILPVASSAT